MSPSTIYDAMSREELINELVEQEELNAVRDKKYKDSLKSLKSYDDHVKLDQCCDWGRFAVYKGAEEECPTNTIEPLDKTVDNMECIGTVLCCLH